MNIIKSFLVVLITYSSILLINVYFISLLSGISIIDIFNAPGLSLINNPIVLTLVLGFILWILRTFLSFSISKFFFKAKGKFNDLLYSFGVSHFPLIFSSLSVFFFFFLGNFGVILSIFLGTFFFLLMLVFFINALITYQKIDWKRGLITVIISEFIIFIILILMTPAYSSFVLPAFANINQIIPNI